MVINLLRIENAKIPKKILQKYVTLFLYGFIFIKTLWLISHLIEGRQFLIYWGVIVLVFALVDFFRYKNMFFGTIVWESQKGHGVKIQKILIFRPNVSLLIVLDEKTGHFHNLI